MFRVRSYLRTKKSTTTEMVKTVDFEEVSTQESVPIISSSLAKAEVTWCVVAEKVWTGGTK